MKWENANIPILIPDLNNIVEISCPYNISFTLTNQGHLYLWGQNTYGELGLGDNIDRNVPTLISNFRVIF